MNTRKHSIASAVLLVAAATLTTITALARQSSVVVMTNSGISASSFCTTTGQVMVVQGVQQDANGQVSFGATYLWGNAGTYSLGPGNHVVAKGCYSHSIVSTTVVGNATAKSTVWYD
jgi:hypothetical protein